MSPDGGGVPSGDLARAIDQIHGGLGQLRGARTRSGGEPSGDLARAIDQTLDGLDKLKAAVNEGGVKRFGSGWTWLVWDGTGLAVYSTANQDSPLSQSDVPLLGIDVWEHADYL